MTSKELNEDLLNQFPEIMEKFEEEASWQDGIDTGSFIIFEDVFMPFVRDSVINRNFKLIERIFNYFEYLSFLKDDYAENVFYIAILENIYSYDDMPEFAKYFKNNTRKIFMENFLKK